MRPPHGARGCLTALAASQMCAWLQVGGVFLCAFAWERARTCNYKFLCSISHLQLLFHGEQTGRRNIPFFFLPHLMTAECATVGCRLVVLVAAFDPANAAHKFNKRTVCDASTRMYTDSFWSPWESGLLTCIKQMTSEVVDGDRERRQSYSCLKGQSS